MDNWLEYPKKGIIASIVRVMHWKWTSDDPVYQSLKTRPERFTVSKQLHCIAEQSWRTFLEILKYLALNSM